MKKSKVKKKISNQEVAVRNYIPEAKWKIGQIIVKERNLHYRVQVDWNIWKSIVIKKKKKKLM